MPQSTFEMYFFFLSIFLFQFFFPFVVEEKRITKDKIRKNVKTERLMGLMTCTDFGKVKAQETLSIFQPLIYEREYKIYRT